MDELIFDDDDPAIAAWETSNAQPASIKHTTKSSSTRSPLTGTELPQWLGRHNGAQAEKLSHSGSLQQEYDEQGGTPLMSTGNDSSTERTSSTMSPGHAAFRSLQMMRHARSLSNTSSGSGDTDKLSTSPSQSKAIFRFGNAPSTFQYSTSPTQGSPTNDSFGVDANLGRRRSIGHQYSRSASSPSSSPTYPSFLALHEQRRPHSRGSGNQSPAFGASLSQDLPMHAHMERSQASAMGVEDILANLPQSPRVSPALEPIAIADADEPWIDLPEPNVSHLPSAPDKDEEHTSSPQSPLRRLALHLTIPDRPTASRIHRSASPARGMQESSSLGYPLTRHRSHSPSGARSSGASSPSLSSQVLHRRSPSLDAGRTAFAASALSGQQITSPNLLNRASSPRISPRVSPLASSESSALRLFPPAPSQDLSMPPRSGWELSDEPDSPTDEDLDVEPSLTSPSSRSRSTSDPSHRPDLSPSSPLLGNVALPSISSPEDSKSPEWGAPLDFNRGPSIELETLSPEDSFQADPFVEATESGTIDEAGLTPVERIFLFAKSEHANHRETVSRMLPLWLPQVEICEAVDYILPLFQSLAEDEDFVKEAFAASLDEVIWFFLLNCPLADIPPYQQDQLEDRDSVDPAVTAFSTQPHRSHSPFAEVPERHSQNGSAEKQTESGTLARPSNSPIDISTHDYSPLSEETLFAPSSGTTLHDQDEVGERIPSVARPQLRLNTFHPLLATMLMSDVSTVSATAQEALVRLLLRLSGKPQAAEDTSQCPPEDELSLLEQAEQTRQHTHDQYSPSPEVLSIIWQDLVDNIVLALFTMESQPPGYASLWPESADKGDHSMGPPDDLSSKFSSFFDDPMASASPAPCDTPDVQQALFVGLTLVGLLADTAAISEDAMAHKVLPALLDAAIECSAMVKKQIVDVFASLCKCLSAETVTSDIAPIIADWSEEPSAIVRRGIATMLPDLATKFVPTAGRAAFIVPIAVRLANDIAATVQQALLEVMGPLIYVFKDDVPNELLAIFIGFETQTPPEAAPRQDGEQAFQPLIPAFAKAPSTSPESANMGNASTWDIAKDFERALITAYNIPGVCLSLGESGWHRIQSLHRNLLLQSRSPQVHYLVASSIHDIASIVGETAAARDLLDLYEKLVDDDDETSFRALERFADFSAALPSRCLDHLANVLHRVWTLKGPTNWCIRELVVEGLFALASRSNNLSDTTALLAMLDAALHDTVAAIRIWASKAASGLLSSGTHPRLREACFSILQPLATAASHHHRALYCHCMCQCLVADIQLDESMLSALAELAEDAVVGVRLMVARLLAKALEAREVFPHLMASPGLRKAAKAILADTAICVQDELKNVDHELLRGLSVHAKDVHPAAGHHDDESNDGDERGPEAKARDQNACVSRGQTALSFNSQFDAQQDDNTDGERDEEHDDHELDLDSSTLYELDLDDLIRSSSTMPPTPPLVDSVTAENPSLQVQSTPNDDGHRTSASRASHLYPYLDKCSSATTSDNSWSLSMRDEEQYVAIDVGSFA